MTELIIKTKKSKEVIDITQRISQVLAEKSVKNGVINIFVTHTTAGLSTADLDPGGTEQDYLDAFDKMIPKLQFRHPHDPAHMPDHILSTLVGTSLTLPVKDAEMILGSWQRVVLIEFDGPRERNIVISFLGKE